MAELLVKAKDHWMDSLKQEDIDKLSDHQKEAYEARTRKGDIIVVRPDGWKWGKKECLPDYVVIKIPNISVKDIKHYEKSLSEVSVIGKDVTLNTDIKKIKKHKLREYALPQNFIDTVATQHNGVYETQESDVNAQIIRKTI